MNSIILASLFIMHTALTSSANIYPPIYTDRLSESENWQEYYKNYARCRLDLVDPKMFDLQRHLRPGHETYKEWKARRDPDKLIVVDYLPPTDPEIIEYYGLNDLENFEAKVEIVAADILNQCRLNTVELSNGEIKEKAIFVTTSDYRAHYQLFFSVHTVLSHAKKIDRKYLDDFDQGMRKNAEKTWAFEGLEPDEPRVSVLMLSDFFDGPWQGQYTSKDLLRESNNHHENLFDDEVSVRKKHLQLTSIHGLIALGRVNLPVK